MVLGGRILLFTNQQKKHSSSQNGGKKVRHKNDVVREVAGRRIYPRLQEASTMTGRCLRHHGNAMAKEKVAEKKVQGRRRQLHDDGSIRALVGASIGSPVGGLSRPLLMLLTFSKYAVSV